MRSLITICTLLLTGTGFSQNAPLPPFPETTFSQGVSDFVDNTPLGVGNWAFDVRIENPNNRPISCRNTSFLAYMDSYGDQCDTPEQQGVYLSIQPGKQSFDLAANEVKTFNKIGNDIRSMRSGDSNRQRLEFCSRAAWNLDCGFSCANGKKYTDEPWSETVAGGGGTIQARCTKEGTIEYDPIGLSCSAGYIPNRISNQCEINCDPVKFYRDSQTNTCVPKPCGANRPNGSTWTEPSGLGDARYRCEYGTPIFVEVICPNYIDFEKVGSTCRLRSRTERVRFGFPTMAHVCGESWSKGPGLPTVWSWAGCKKGQHLLWGPYLNFSFPGRYKVTFHVQVNSGFTSPQTQLAVFDVSSELGKRVLASRVITFGELQGFFSPPPSRGTVYLMGGNFQESRIERLGDFPTFTAGQTFKSIELTFESLIPLTNFETRVLVLDGYPTVAGIDIEFYPY